MICRKRIGLHLYLLLKAISYQILIKTLTEEQKVGITVTNVFGWNAYQIQLIGEIVSIATVVAPIAAIVKGISWLFGYLQRRNKQAKKKVKLQTLNLLHL